jgi:predicted nucleic acid-binding protein
MKIPPELRGLKGVVLDTMFFVYLFEDVPRYADLCEYLIKEAETGLFSAVITPITAAELLVKPLSQGREDTADRYRNTLRSYRNIRPVEITLETACLAAGLRAQYHLPLPDVMQAAIALQSTHPVMITNDSALRKIKEVRVLQLDEML